MKNLPPISVSNVKVVTVKILFCEQKGHIVLNNNNNNIIIVIIGNIVISGNISCTLAMLMLLLTSPAWSALHNSH